MLGSKTAIIISIISLFFSILSLSHDFLIKEYGLVIGNTEYVITPSEKIKIVNDIQCLAIAPTIDISNNGTLPIRINKMKAFIQFNASHHVFTTMDTISVAPNNQYKEYIWFIEKYPDSDRTIKDKLQSNITNDLMSTYHTNNEKNNNGLSKPIFLSKKLYEELCKNLKKQVEWMKADDEYYLLLMFWINSDKKYPDVRCLYKFALNNFQIQIISDFQSKALKTPNMIPGNVSVTYEATPNLIFINDKDKVSTVYESYKRYSVKTN